MKVQDPEGTTWKVTRRWLPWRRRFRNKYADDLDFLSVGGDDPISVFLWFVGLILAIPAIVLGILVTIEFAALLVVFPLVLLGRVLLGRHWTVVVRRKRELWSESDGGDWQASGLLVHDLAARIERGEPPRRFLGGPVRHTGEPAVAEPPVSPRRPGRP